MPKKDSSGGIRTDNREAIMSAAEGLSPSLHNYIETHPSSQFILWSKNLFHSDLINAGKRNGPTQTMSRNYLYYMSVREMCEIEKLEETTFPDAKQSNIGLAKKFFADINAPSTRECPGNHYKISDYNDVYLVNDTLQYFTITQTNAVLRKLEKPWNYTEANSNYRLDDGPFTRISLTEAVHGIGTKDDDVFSKLRLSMFQGDILNILIEKKNGRNAIFIFLEKNPRFFTITGLADDSWVRYLRHKADSLQNRAKVEDRLPEKDAKTRTLQAQWKKKLAQEMMTYTAHEGEVICPFTRIAARFEDVPMLFIASHIKAYKECSVDEAYDLDNGLLLCANADALFDKHMITVDPTGSLKFSYLIHDEILKENLRLQNRQVLSLILNPRRMKYLAIHQKIFEDCEVKRRQGLPIDEEDEKEAVIYGELHSEPTLQMAASPCKNGTTIVLK